MFLVSIPLSLELLVEIQSIPFTLHIPIFYFGVVSSPHLHMVCCDCYICVYLYIYTHTQTYANICSALDSCVFYIQFYFSMCYMCDIWGVACLE